MDSLTEIQFTLLNKLAVGDVIRARWSEVIRYYFDAFSPAGAEIEIGGRLGGKRCLTRNTLDGLTKKGYLTYDDTGLGRWTRTDKSHVTASIRRGKSR